MRELAAKAAESLATGRSGRVARVVGFEGFGGRRAGETVLAYADGASTGSLLGGTADSALRAQSGAAGIFEVAVGDADAVAAGLACGGVARVLFNEVATVPRTAWEALSGGRPVALVTRLDAAPGSSCVLALIDSPGARTLERHGSLGDPVLDEIAAQAARLALRHGRDLAEVEVHEGSSLVVEVWLPSTTLIVIGEGQLAEALAAQGALVGWVVRLERAWDEPTTDAVQNLGPTDALVVLSHDPDVDTPALAQGLSTRAYVGALGSRHTQAGRRERLSELGLGADSIRRIHGPVGLDLGARTPEETAVAIVAEILAHRSGRGAASLNSVDGPING